MRVLITGYGGFVGRHLAAELAAMTPWRLWGTTWRADAAPPPVDQPVEPVAVDLRDPAAVVELFEALRPDIVFHLAAQSFVPDSWRDPWGTFETNVRMQLNVLQAAREQRARPAPGGPGGHGPGGLGPSGLGPRIVVASTNEVYGAASVAGAGTDESAPLAPRNPYATSKAAQDLMAGEFAARWPDAGAVDVVRLRPFTHIGPGQDDRFVAASFAHQVAEIEAGRSSGPLKVGDLSARRDFSDVRDIVRGYRLAAERGAAGVVYNLGAGRSRAVQEIVDHFVSRARVPVKVEVDPARLRPSDVPETRCDARRAHDEIGWAPSIPFETTLDDILADWRLRVATGAVQPTTA
ncbi:MAG: GDP-mannose 4,6-dehydratase [Ardenticatenales bacterium]|nr:GDP-mannose 4,6-dehydratase [Ardenticatenales bacterium]